MMHFRNCYFAFNPNRVEAVLIVPLTASPWRTSLLEHGFTVAD